VDYLQGSKNIVVSEPAQIDETAAGQPAKPIGYSDLARRIRSRTTDFLAICIVLVASLTLGRQILIWWHAPTHEELTAREANTGPPAWGDNQEAVALEFGDLPVGLTRQSCTGTPSAALATIVANCEAATRSADRPLHESDPVEVGLLQKLSDSKPASEHPGDWQVHVVDERFLLVAGLRRLPAEHSGDAARSEWRLVCWGMGMPAGAESWTTFVMRGTGGAVASRSGVPEVPIPPESRRSLALNDERGAALVGFSGAGDPEHWMQFYDRWFSGNGWTPAGGWSIGAEVWSARFAGPTDREGMRVEVRFARDRRGELTGLWQVIQPGSND
jgi:hypothetical protein